MYTLLIIFWLFVLVLHFIAIWAVPFSFTLWYLLRCYTQAGQVKPFDWTVSIITSYHVINWFWLPTITPKFTVIIISIIYFEFTIICTYDCWFPGVSLGNHLWKNKGLCSSKCFINKICAWRYSLVKHVVIAPDYKSQYWVSHSFSYCCTW